MNDKKILIPILVTVLALILLAVYFLPRQEATPSVQTPGTVPAVQDRTEPTLPDQTEEPESLPTETSDSTKPEQTDPKHDDPVWTEPEETEPEPEYSEPQQIEPTAPPAYLAQLEGGLVTVQSLFQFSGMNPDADNEFGDEIAGIELTNNSDRHMTFAEVAVIMADGTALSFRAEDVPAGRTVMAFSLEHASVKSVTSCEEIYGYAEFESGDPMLSGQVLCTVNGAEITVQNLTGETLTDLEVTCHGLLDSSFFGGSTYRYNVSTLPAGASTVIHAWDCILGMAEVVRVDLGG